MFTTEKEFKDKYNKDLDVVGDTITLIVIIFIIGLFGLLISL